jgi:hypothetical protein
MINYKSIGAEYITGAFLGGLALVISLLIGFISGNRMSLVFFRTVINTLLFTGIGIVCIFVIKKFVPEVYQVFSTLNDAENIEIKTEEFKDNTKAESSSTSEIASGINDMTEPETKSSLNHEDKELENEFNILDKQPAEFSDGSDFSSNDSNIENNTRGTVKNKSIKYEPKIAAQAIRTMMKKDE